MFYECSLDGYALILSFWCFDADRKTKMATIEPYGWTQIWLWLPSFVRVISIDMVQVGGIFNKASYPKMREKKNNWKRLLVFSETDKISALEDYCENEAKDYCGFTLQERNRVNLGKSQLVCV
jgi:hypothetical protein